MIKAEHLTKTYGPLTAVDDLSFKVEPGEVLGFLGPNGAGKTTTMRMFAGFVPPTSGHAEICGFRVDNDPIEAKRRLGYLPEGAPAYGEMTPREFLEFVAAARGLRGNDKQEKLNRVITRLNLGPVLGQSIETLSKGFKRRVGLAQAIIHDPPVLILDEPTDGLDPNQKHEVRELIAEMASNKIIVISTHILEEVDAVCNRAVIVASGKIVADETPGSLIRQSRYHNAVTLKFSNQDSLQDAGNTLRAVPAIADIEIDVDAAAITALPRGEEALLEPIGNLVQQHSWRLRELKLESGRLDEVFRRITAAGTG